MAIKQLNFLAPYAQDPELQILSLRVPSGWNVSDLRRALKVEYPPFKDRSPGEIKVLVLSQYLNYPHTPDPSKLVTDSEKPTYDDIPLAKFGPLENIVDRFPTAEEGDLQIHMIVYVGQISPSNSSSSDLAALGQVHPMKADLPNARREVQYCKKNWGHALDLSLTQIPTPAVNALDDDGDLLPGRPVMDLSLESNDGEILIRADYLRIYNAIKHICGHVDPNEHRPPAIVVTGQPGIGKSMWIYYAIRRRLGEGLPIIWYQRKAYHQFYKNRVLRDINPEDDFLDASEPRWCLVDSAEAPHGLPDLLSSISIKGVIPIYVTSPDHSRWKKLHKTRSTTVLYMNPWTEQEITAAFPLYKNINAAEAIRRYREFGPTAHICLSYKDAEVKVFEANRRTGIENLTMDSLKSMISNAPLANSFVAFSHTIILIRRPNNNSSSLEEMIIDLMSKTVADQILDHLQKRRNVASIELWRSLSQYSDLGSYTIGPVFEAYAHRQLRPKIEITLQPMKLARSRYHMQPIGNDSIQLNFTPSDHHVYPPDKKVVTKVDVYYQPQSRQQVAIDAFFRHDEFLYLLQYTIGKDHTVNAGLANFLEKFVTPQVPRDKWRFVFVIPDALGKFNVIPGEGLSELHYYTAKLLIVDDNEL